MQKHRELQDQIAEDMLRSVSTLKQNSLAARSTIEKDTDVGWVGWEGYLCELKWEGACGSVLVGGVLVGGVLVGVEVGGEEGGAEFL